METLEAKEFIKRKRADRRYKGAVKVLSVCLFISIFNLFLLINGINLFSSAKNIGSAYLSSETGQKIISAIKEFAGKVVDFVGDGIKAVSESGAKTTSTVSYSSSLPSFLSADSLKLDEKEFFYVDKTPPTPDGFSLEPIFISRKLSSPLDSLKVTSPFGWRIHPFAKKVLFHTGTDYAAATGDNVYCVLKGTVEECGFDNSFGNFIVISHPGNIKTKYAHLDEIIVSEGAVLKEGEIIGKAGSTGGSTGPHLHFEIRLNGITYNPQYVLEE